MLIGLNCTIYKLGIGVFLFTEEDKYVLKFEKLF